jgi:RND family efflux transporter MFP subunit
MQPTTEKNSIMPSAVISARYLALGGMAFVMAAVLLTGCRSGILPKNVTPQAVSKTSVRVMPVVMSVFPRVLQITGSVAPEYQADIETRTPGRVERVLVKEGDFVRYGQPVLELDARDLDAAILEASANVSATETQIGNAKAALAMEQASSPARVRKVEAQLSEANAALRSVRAQRDLVQAGPRSQERQRAVQAVVQAESSLVLARNTFDRMKQLYDREAVSGQDFDQAKSAYDTAQAQYQSALLAQSQTDEGSRSEEKRVANNAVGQAEAAVTQAQAGLQEAKAGTLAINLRRADVARAESSIDQARAALAIAIANRSYSTITAPFDGVIAARMADPGVMAGPGVALLKIQGGALRLEANVPESALGATRVGRSVPITIDALGDQAVYGKIETVARRGDTASHTFLVKIQLTPGSGARAGMYGRADLSLGEDRFAAVPISAVVARDGLAYVYIVGDDHIARLRFVTTGSASQGLVPLLSGAQPGDRVVVSGTERMHDGVRVSERRG